MKILENQKQKYMINLMKNLKFKFKFILFANLLILIDLLSKGWADTVLQQKIIPVIDNFFNFALAYNTGVSFSMFNSLNNGEVILSVFAIFAGIIFLILSFGSKKKVDSAGYMLIFAGALGNGIDRLINGHVIDFLDFYYKTWHYPTFNFADCYIFIGVFLILFFEILHEKLKKNK